MDHDDNMDQEPDDLLAQMFRATDERKIEKDRQGMAEIILMYETGIVILDAEAKERPKYRILTERPHRIGSLSSAPCFY
jgi:hypothetical protein